MMKRYTYTNVEYNISKFLLKIAEIDCNPVGQRNNVERGYGKKAEAIIRGYLEGKFTGAIVIHERQRQGTEGFKYESIDGGHRKRYIKAFHENKFSVDGLYFKDLEDADKENFLSIPLIFIIYSNLAAYDIGYIFRSLNETTDVNHQEMLNSNGDMPVANHIREMSREVMGVGNQPHRLFTHKDNDPTEKYKTFYGDNMRLANDERVARIYCRYINGGGLGVANDKALDEMYKMVDLSDTDMDKYSKMVNNHLDFIHHMTKSFNMRNGGSNPMPLREYQLFTRLFFYLEETYKSFKIDYYNFYVYIVDNVAPFWVKDKDAVIPELQVKSRFDTLKSRAQQFRDTLKEYKNEEAIRETLGWFIERIDITTHITVRDPKRLFTKDEKIAKLVEQGYTCPISGTSIDLTNSEGDHMIPWSLGGPTKMDNLVMLHKDIHKEKGTMTYVQYVEVKSMAKAA
jgi:5-methylcytosine-specific restriction endonuclease McrA